jgi:hypothetical protein
MICDVNSVTVLPGIVTAIVLSTISYQKSIDHCEVHIEKLNHDRSYVLWLGLDLSWRIILCFAFFMFQEGMKSFIIVRE